MAIIDPLDLEDLAVALCELNPDMDTSEIETALEEKYGIGLDQFHTLISDILPLITIDVSPITSIPYVGIGNRKEWLIHKACKSEFIRCALEFFKNVNNQTITINGVPVYEIIPRQIREVKEGGEGK